MFSITVTLDPPIDEFRKNWNRARKRGLKDTGNHWVQNFLKRHFTFEGARRYGYKSRSKQRKFGPKGFETFKNTRWIRQFQRRGSRLPLVHSGVLKRDAISGATVRVYGSISRIIMSVPGYIRFRGRKGTGLDMVRELTSVTTDEAEILADKFLRGVSRGLMKIRKRRRIGKTRGIL